MALSFNLADLFVTFVSKGVDDLHRAISSLNANLAGVKNNADAVWKSVEKSEDWLKKFGEAAGRVGGAARIHFETLEKLVRRTFGSAMKESVDQANEQMTRFLSFEFGLSARQDSYLRGLLTTYVKLTQAQQGLQAALEKVNAAAQYLQSTIGRGLSVLGGFVAAGIASSNTGEILANRLGFLSRTIAGLFQPEIQAVIRWIERLNTWLQSLTEQQKESLVWWIKVAAGVVFFSYALPAAIGLTLQMVTAAKMLTSAFLFLGGSQVIGAIGTLINAIRALTITQIVMQAVAGPAGWLALAAGILIAAGAVGTYIAMTKDATAATDSLTKRKDTVGRGPLAPRGSAFESLQSAWERIARSTIGGGYDEGLELQRQTARNVDDIRRLLENLKPAVI
jgi:hypothetical protein